MKQAGRIAILLILVAISFLSCVYKRTTINISDVLKIEMVFVESGTFTMGCTFEPEIECENNEKPTHQVTLTKDFYIGKYEITQGQWSEIMQYNPSFHDEKRDDNLPVEQVSWTEVQKFIKCLNTKTGKKYRLPTEAEWEFAARGGNKSKGYKCFVVNDVSGKCRFWRF